MSDQPTGSATDDAFSSASRPARWSLFRLGGFVLTQLLALTVFVGFPALVTATAPVSWVRSERHAGRMTATVHTCLLFVVPYRSRRIDPVIRFGDRFVGGRITRKRRPAATGSRNWKTKALSSIQGPIRLRKSRYRRRVCSRSSRVPRRF